jgi:hypothetical protein
MKGFWVIGMLVLGIVQMFAILQGFVDALGPFFGFIAALICGEFPVLGTIMGIRGAVLNWGWSIWGGLGLFLGAPLALLGISMIAFRND